MTTTELETLNLIQPMDDTRREMYIRARARIVSRDETFICWALLRELGNTCNIEVIKGTTEGEILLEEFFPEFFAMHDGVFWPLGLSEKSRPVGQTASQEAWFDYLDRPRRLRLLDFLITHR